ncbi:sugar transferase [Alphaproteobacteria bacterium]|nr:sugar transferase [Alphaproteobacteria bacterium]
MGSFDFELCLCDSETIKMNMKRFLDVLLAALGVVTVSPILIVMMFLIFLQDLKSPLYLSRRVGLYGEPFLMFKLRSMVFGGDSSGVFSTSNNDLRITNIGRFLRRTKLDELPQLLNVFLGQMTFVGPRANVISEVNEYTVAERKLLEVKPGITDFASIVYFDEGAVLAESRDPDKDYKKLIWPGKSKLGMFYVENQSPMMDLQLIFITLISFCSRQTALSLLAKQVKRISGDPELVALIGDRITPQRNNSPSGTN